MFLYGHKRERIKFSTSALHLDENVTVLLNASLIPQAVNTKHVTDHLSVRNSSSPDFVSAEIQCSKPLVL